MKVVVLDQAGQTYGPWESMEQAMKDLEALGFHRYDTKFDTPLDYPTHFKRNAEGKEYGGVRLLLLQPSDRFAYFHEKI